MGLFNSVTFRFGNCNNGYEKPLKPNAQFIMFSKRACTQFFEPFPHKSKLRLLYEANPIAFLAEQAGGVASDRRQRILEKQPQSIHERTPLIIGSRDEVKRVLSFWGG